MGTPVVAQSFDNTLQSITEMRNAAQDVNASVQNAIQRLDGLQWTGQSRESFNAVSEEWRAAVLAEMTRLEEYAALTEQVVNEQQDSEQQRAQQAQSVQVGTAAGGTQVGSEGGGTQVGSAGGGTLLGSAQTPGTPAS